MSLADQFYPKSPKSSHNLAIILRKTGRLTCAGLFFIPFLTFLLYFNRPNRFSRCLLPKWLMSQIAEVSRLILEFFSLFWRLLWIA